MSAFPMGNSVAAIFRISHYKPMAFLLFQDLVDDKSFKILYNCVVKGLIRSLQLVKMLTSM